MVWRAELESVCHFITSRLSSLVSHFSVVTVNVNLTSQYMSPGDVAMLGTGSLYAISGDKTRFILPEHLIP